MLIKHIFTMPCAAQVGKHAAQHWLDFFNVPLLLNSQGCTDAYWKLEAETGVSHTLCKPIDSQRTDPGRSLCKPVDTG